MRMKRERLQFLETNVEAEQNQEEPERPTLSEEVTTLKTLRIPLKRVQLEQVAPLHRRQAGGAGGGQEEQDEVEDGTGESQVLERPTLFEGVSTPRTRDNSQHFSDSRNRQNLDNSVYDFQPMEGKYSVVKSKFGKFSVGVGHKKIKSRGKLF